MFGMYLFMGDIIINSLEFKFPNWTPLKRTKTNSLTKMIILVFVNITN